MCVSVAWWPPPGPRPHDTFTCEGWHMKKVIVMTISNLPQAPINYKLIWQSVIQRSINKSTTGQQHFHGSQLLCVWRKYYYCLSFANQDFTAIGLSIPVDCIWFVIHQVKFTCLQLSWIIIIKYVHAPVLVALAIASILYNQMENFYGSHLSHWLLLPGSPHQDNKVERKNPHLRGEDEKW